MNLEGIITLWVGFMTAAWLFTLMIGGYAIWRYSFKPWQVMRKDIAALDTRITQISNAVSPSRISSMSDEQLASLENRLRNARRASGLRES